MRRTVVEVLVLALLLTGAGLGLGQQQQPRKTRVEEEDEPPRAKAEKGAAQKSKLEGMLAEALKNNPDMRVAAARVTKAEAELQRARLQTAEKVITLYHAIENQKAVVQDQEQEWKRIEKLGSQVGGLVSERERARAQLQLTLAKAKLAELEAQLPALLGRSVGGSGAGGQTRAGASDSGSLGYYPPSQALVGRGRAALHGPMADRIREALARPVKVSFKEVPFSEVLVNLENLTPGITFRNWMAHRKENPPVTLRFDEPMPLGAVLQAIEDYFQPSETYHGIRFVAREYGILVAHEAHLPPGAVRLHQLGQEPKEDTDKPSVRRNPPPENVEGVVKRVDASGLLTISIGSDAGLAKGHTLELYRLGSAPKYLGTVRVLEVTPTQAVCQPVGRLTTPPQLGDKVASRILGQ